ncbi:MULTISPECIES: hypothetical protein [unclassified Sphingomonas]|uniref:hypothetical protein n=1 Tax=unclassified Sphingomonas TaxID=196159 RepID=UPI000927731B|nr:MULTISPECIES: hypothetical protein [unclassified Sphingomonas]MBN8849932.1 hypothetical protein [Sphingomonas sp.]OJV28611.1 MAG: hypothetical protein BGO24_05985 [Sphingomonas sp. 67-36]
MTWAAALGIVRRFWWAIPIAALTIALHFTRVTLADRTATLESERKAWTAELLRADTIRPDGRLRPAPPCPPMRARWPIASRSLSAPPIP